MLSVYVYVCSYMCICVHVHTPIYCRILFPLHMDLQHARKYMISLPCIPYINFIVTQIGNVSNCNLEVLKIRLSCSWKTMWARANPQSTDFISTDSATYKGWVQVFILPCNDRTKEENRRKQRRKHACSVETQLPEIGEQGNNGLWK